MLEIYYIEILMLNLIQIEKINHNISFNYLK